MPNNNKSPAEPLPEDGNTLPSKPKASRPCAPLMALGAVLVVIVLNGCASTNAEANDPYKYNRNTDYPFTGGPFDHQRP